MIMNTKLTVRPMLFRGGKSTVAQMFVTEEDDINEEDDPPLLDEVMLAEAVTSVSTRRSTRHTRFIDEGSSREGFRDAKLGHENILWTLRAFKGPGRESQISLKNRIVPVDDDESFVDTKGEVTVERIERENGNIAATERNVLFRYHRTTISDGTCQLFSLLVAFVLVASVVTCCWNRRVHYDEQIEAADRMRSSLMREHGLLQKQQATSILQPAFSLDSHTTPSGQRSWSLRPFPLLARRTVWNHRCPRTEKLPQERMLPPGR